MCTVLQYMFYSVRTLVGRSECSFAYSVIAHHSRPSCSNLLPLPMHSLTVHCNPPNPTCTHTRWKYTKSYLSPRHWQGWSMPVSRHFRRTDHSTQGNSGTLSLQTWLCVVAVEPNFVTFSLYVQLTFTIGFCRSTGSTFMVCLVKSFILGLGCICIYTCWLVLWCNYLSNALF